MEIGKFDFFKIIIVILLGIFIYLYDKNSDVGRFQLESNRGAIIDTKTGQTYLWDMESFYSKKETPPILK
jgi:hypothetical protein